MYSRAVHAPERRHRSPVETAEAKALPTNGELRIEGSNGTTGENPPTDRRCSSARQAQN